MTGPIRVAELDFDTIKSNLVSYMKTQEGFTDYAYDSSGLNSIINLLSYGIHYNSFYISMGVSERYLDSAVTRPSVVSAAKLLNFSPTSATASEASVDINVTSVTSAPTSIVLPKYSKFTAVLPDNSASYYFTNTEAATATKIGNTYTFAGLTIKEGTPLTYSYVVGAETTFIYEIPNDNCDTSTIKVTIQNSTSDLTQVTYTKFSTLIGVTGTSTIFFVEENYRGKTQIQFGDGVIGKSPVTGNVIIIEYVITSGLVANGITSFSLDQNTFGSGNIVTTLSNTTPNGSSGGADKQSIESIKFTAPKSYVAQNRLVTTQDFYAEVASVSSIESVSVWGGEDNIPAVYGSVFISAKPIGSLYLSATLKNDILTNRLKPKKVSTITPVFVDPDYTYINTHITAKYDKNINNLEIGDMENIVRTAISTFETNQLGKFNSDFLYESYLAFLAASNNAIISTYAVNKLQKRYTPSLNVSLNQNINFNTSIQQNRLISTKFYVYIVGILRLVSFIDVSSDESINSTSIGKLQLFSIDDNVVYQDNVGTVDYNAGLVSINPITVNSLPTGSSDIRITVVPQEGVFDINTYRNNIIIFDDSHIDSSINLNNGQLIDIIPV